MRRKQVEVTGTLTVVDKATGEPVAEVSVAPVDSPSGTPKPLDKWEYCHYCGKVPEKTPYGYYLGVLEAIPGGTYWDHCQKGRDAGVLELIRLNHISIAKEFQEKYLPYKEHRPCPKCGNEHRTTEYNVGQPRRGNSIYGNSHPFIHPYIFRNCGRCTFTSYEVPLDFDPETIFPPEQEKGK